MKNIQIPEQLFYQICSFFLMDVDEYTENIKKGLEDKLDGLVRHESYTRYKTAETPEEREKARKEYLDRIGIPDSFRW